VQPGPIRLASMPLQIVATRPDPALMTLPWHLPLEEWDEHVVPLPRGISRHIVRFVQLSKHVYAVKETREPIAHREYRTLRELRRLGEPAVEPVGVVTGRVGSDGEPIEPALVTRHLTFSMPYRAMFSQGLGTQSTVRLVDALVVLLTRLHLAGFFWGDCSLSNTLFRPSAGAYAAYLVDAETGELHDSLSDGQRAHDLDIATSNVFAEILDLQAGGYLDESVDPYEIVDLLGARYEALWGELTAPEEFDTNEMWRIEQRIRRLNQIGFDVDELDIVTDWDGATVRIQPKVVDAGHHTRRLQALTGLNVEENQAQRLLNDLDAFAAAHALQQEDETVIAHKWLTQVFEPIVRMVPPELRGKLEPAEIFHEILEHRWYLNEDSKTEIDLFEAARDYVDEVLTTKPDTEVTPPPPPDEGDLLL
jgi:tRNA A-37 threonylcarbamoyl transferase component Bud32